MRYLILLLLFFCASNGVFAQQALSKKDQQRKAEFLAQIEAEKKYEETISKADQAFVDKDYVKSRMLFNDAIQYSKENEQWLISKVNDLDILMAEIIAREVDTIDVISKKEIAEISTPEIEVSEIESRDEKMVVSLLVVQEKPQITEPQIAEPKEQAKRQTDSEPKAVVRDQSKAVPPKMKSEPKSSERVKEGYSKYPQGRTDETFTFPNHTVRRVIVRDGIDTIVYKYVTHKWGGKFYFKDDVSIVERIWKEEVEAFEEKYPTNSAEQ
jgi:hypothetical protein